MAARSGWDTIFAEPIRWSRNKTVKKCLGHIIKNTIVTSVCIMLLLWFTQVHRYLYNYLYGPFVLSEQEILDTRPENMWKQYIQVHHGKPLPLKTKGVGCGRTPGSRCTRMILQFDTRATHNRNISQLVVKTPLPHVYQSSVRHPINFSAMSVKKLRAIIRKIGKEKSVIRGMEKTDLISIISKAYDSSPKEFNQATASEVSVGFLRDLNALTLIPKLEYMDLLLDTSVQYIDVISSPTVCALLLVIYLMEILYYNFKITHTWASSSRILTSFASTEFQKQILESLRHFIHKRGLQVNTSGYQLAALNLQEEIRSDEVSTIVDEEHFRLFVTNRHVIYAKNDIVEVISVNTIERITTSIYVHACDVVLSSGERRTLWMSSDQVGRMKNARALSARLRQTKERRAIARQQREEERRRQLQREEERRRQLQEEEARRRQLQEEEAMRRQLQREEERRRQLQRQEEMRRQLQEEEARRRQEEEERRLQEEEARRRQRQAELEARQRQQLYAEAADERSVTEDAMKKIRESTCELMEDSTEKCAICLDLMKTGSTGEKVTKFSCPGKHQFHEHCLLKWLEHGSSCPVCRHPAGQRSRRENAIRVLQLVFMSLFHVTGTVVIVFIAFVRRIWNR